MSPVCNHRRRVQELEHLVLYHPDKEPSYLTLDRPSNSVRLNEGSESNRPWLCLDMAQDQSNRYYFSAKAKAVRAVKIFPSSTLALLITI